MNQKKRYSRTTTGCLCCRLRRKKCNEQQPTCSGCVRNGLICSWPQGFGSHGSDFGWRIKLGKGGKVSKVPEEIQIHQDTVAQSVVLHHQLSKPPPFQKIPSAISGYDREILHSSEIWSCLDQYFHQTAAQLVATSAAENPLLHFVMPRALSDRMIMRAILAVGGIHLSHRTKSTQIKIAALTQYSLTLKELKHSLTAWVAGVETNPIRLLLTTLLLYNYEVNYYETNSRLENLLTKDI